MNYSTKVLLCAVGAISILVLLIFVILPKQNEANKEMVEVKIQKPTFELIDINRRMGVHSFEYEGHKYLVSSQSGMLHLESCQCKTNILK